MKRSGIPGALSFLFVLSLFLSVAGCGCQEHSVSEVTVSPDTPCLTVQAGGGTSDYFDPGAVGMCESLYLYTENSCSDPVTIQVPTEAGIDAPTEPLTVEAGDSFTFEFPGWSSRNFELQATLGTQPITLTFAVGGQCGVSGSCD
jgi:hypothetical protein